MAQSYWTKPEELIVLKKSKGSKAAWIFLVLMLCFIWGNSLLPASYSSALSLWAKDLLSTLLGSVSTEETVTVSHNILRKLAHISEFALLGVAVARLMDFRFRKYCWYFFFSGLVVAFFDETIQLFSEDRGAQISDVWIDLGGYFLGGLLSFGIAALVRRAKQVRN